MRSIARKALDVLAHLAPLPAAWFALFVPIALIVPHTRALDDPALRRLFDAYLIVFLLTAPALIAMLACRAFIPHHPAEPRGFPVLQPGAPRHGPRDRRDA